MPGPLSGIRVVEFEGIGPAPYCGMLLADLGADVIRIARPRADRGPLIAHDGHQPIDRGRTLVTLDLKDPDDKAGALALLSKADAMIEGLRPGVMERLGLGPAEVHGVNPKLVYCRITGWGQTGDWAHAAGHDLSYIAVSGALAAMGYPDRPPSPPLNLVGDFGGGGLFAAFGIVSALLHAQRTGEGQVVDSAMVDGAASQMAPIYSMFQKGAWTTERGANLLDGAAPFYRCYECSDGRYIAAGPIEPQFFKVFMEGIGLDPADWDQTDRASWPACAEAIQAKISEKPRDHWGAHFAGTDACVAPVLDMGEAAEHPHNASRETFLPGPTQPAPAPRFSATPGETGSVGDLSLEEARSRWS